MEVELGITERISTGERFPSAMKLMYVFLCNLSLTLTHRFQDFHVQEVSNDGNVLKLSELIIRSTVSDELKASSMQADAAFSSIGPSFVFTLEQSQALHDFLCGSDFEGLESFLKSEPSESTPYCVLSGTALNSDKDRRKAFHAYIREQFGQSLSTDTFEDGESRSLRVWIKKFHAAEQDKYKTQFHNAKRQKLNTKTGPPPGASVGVMMKDPWPKDRPNYLHFNMYKENRDTAEAIQSIARCLRIPPKSFQFPGTKDRRGITVQSVSVYRISKEALKRAILHSAWDKAVRVSDLEYKDFPHKIGSSRGNHFKIALKRIPSEFSDDQINNLFSSFEKNGFYNYYGPQRFGTRSVRTHHIGILLLTGNWKGVVDALLSPAADQMVAPEDQTNPDQPAEDTVDSIEAPEIETESKPESVSRTQWRNEYALGNIAIAHDQCPPYMYIEKSLLRALHMSGQSGNHLNAIQALPASTVQLYLHAVQSLIFNAVLSERVTQFGRTVVVGDLVMIGDAVVEVESEEEAAKHTFDQVVLPLVGTSVKIPSNMRPFYETFCQTKLDQLSLDTFTSPAAGTQKFLILSGAYRRIVSRPNRLTWSIHHNVADDQVIIKSDVDILKQALGKVDDNERDQISEPPAQDTPATTSKAVVFECSLDSGVYLTMAAREVTELIE